MKIKEYDTVKLKDGRIGSVVMIYREGKGYEIDFGDSAETIDLKEVEKVLK